MPNHIPEVILGSLLTIAILAIGLVIGAQFFSNPALPPASTFTGGASQATPPANSQVNEDREIQRKLVDETEELARFTEWLVVATSILGLAAFWQTIVTRGGMRRQLRAYVFVTQAKIIDPDGAEPQAEITIKNSGQTPAYNMIFTVTVMGFNPQDPRVFPAPPVGPDSSIFVLGPGAGGSKNMPLMTLLNANIMTTLRARTQHILYAWGEVRYQDAFRKSRYTKFRVSIGGPSGWPDTNLMVVSPEGNDAN